MVRKVVSKLRKIERRVVIALLIIIPVSILGASFFVHAAAQVNMSSANTEYWMEHREEITSSYQKNGITISDIAGVIQFNDKNIVPFFTNIENVKEGACIFGNTVPGQEGRTIILGHTEQGFAYLSNIEVGDEIVVDSLEGKCVYTVMSTKVVVPSEIPFDETDDSVLTLVSQYPFRTLSATNRRYVVEAILN